MSRYKFTSESVTEGHPDKICDQSVDALLDAYLSQDSRSRVALEMFVKTKVYVGGEVTTTAKVEVEDAIRKVIRGIGYNSGNCGIDGNSCEIVQDITEQSPDIAIKVNEKRLNDSPVKEQGAGDQGMMFGYAVSGHGPEYMPLPIMLANNITRTMALARKDGSIDWLLPDGKAQVTVEYDDGVPALVHTIVVSAQHVGSVRDDKLRSDIISKVIRPACGKWYSEDIRFLINPGGAFTLGGPGADSGLTGRKIVVDTYGGWSGSGGGSFSGKDPSKVDRSAAYMMRYIAKNIVAAGLAKECSAEVAYAIGLADPVSFRIDTRGTGLTSDEKLETIALKIFDLRPKQIVEQLDLLRPIYHKTSCYGHFGRAEPEFTWERIDKVPLLRKEASTIGVVIPLALTT